MNKSIPQTEICFLGKVCPLSKQRGECQTFPFHSLLTEMLSAFLLLLTHYLCSHPPKHGIVFAISCILFETLASLQEIDGKALLLLRSDMVMKYMGLKLGPALKLCYHIERLKQAQRWRHSGSQCSPCNPTCHSWDLVLPFQSIFKDLFIPHMFQPATRTVSTQLNSKGWSVNCLHCIYVQKLTEEKIFTKLTRFICVWGFFFFFNLFLVFSPVFFLTLF